jgi:hypothetical protein
MLTSGAGVCLHRRAGRWSESPAAQVWPLDGPRETPPSDGTRARYARPVDAREYVILAELVDHPGVTRLCVVPGRKTLDDLHQLLRRAFGWEDDHLYSFWLNSEFWSGPESEYTSPVEAEPSARTTDVALDELGLEPGREIAYLFDFGDEWRASLRVEEIRPQRGTQARVERSVGEAPPQYELVDES